MLSFTSTSYPSLGFSQAGFVAARPAWAVWHQLWHVNAKIQDKEDILPDQRCFTDGRTPSDHNVQQEYILHLVTSLCGGMQIIVRNSAAETAPLDDEVSNIIDTVKATVQDKEAIPPYQQCLLFVDRQLEDCGAVSEYDIQKENPLHVALRLQASMQIFVKHLVCKTIAPLDDDTSDAIDILVEILALGEEASVLCLHGSMTIFVKKMMTRQWIPALTISSSCS